MKKGGYQIIDLKDTPLTTDSGAMVIDGLYSLIESTNKTILVSGIVIDGVEYNDTFVEFTEDGSNYVGTMYGKTITIQDNNVINITEGSKYTFKTVTKSIIISGTVNLKMSKADILIVTIIKTNGGICTGVIDCSVLTTYGKTLDLDGYTCVITITSDGYSCEVNKDDTYSLALSGYKF